MDYSTRVRIQYELHNIIIKNNLTYEDAQESFDLAMYTIQHNIRYFHKNPDDIVTENPVSENLQRYYGICPGTSSKE